MSWFVAIVATAGASVDCAKEKHRAPADSAGEVGSISLKSRPTDVAVFVAGRQRRLGRTPLLLKRRAGEHLDLLLVKEGYAKARESLLFSAGEAREVRVVLRKLSGELLVRIGPLRGASVRVDGVLMGRAPAKLRLPVGERRIEVRLDGFHPFLDRVTIRNKHPLVIDVPLLPKRKHPRPLGYVSVFPDAPGLVYIDGKLIGSAPVERLPIDVGGHRLLVKSAALDRKVELELQVVAGEHQRVRPALRGGGG